MLKLTRPYTDAPGVTRLQELLDGIDNRYDTGRNDGIFGPLTELAVKRFQTDYKLTVDGIVGPKTWRAILRATDEVLDDGTVSADVIIDRRGMHKPPKLWGRFRTPGEVIGVTLHQTGCEMPSKPSGWDRLNAHIGITQEGKAIIVNDFLDMIWHAQGLSHRTISIEIEGNYYGAIGVEWTFWEPGGGPHHLNGKMIVAIDAICNYLADWFDKFSKWKYLHAHRQSGRNRASDPGQEIWNAVAIPWMQRAGLDDGGENFKLWKGKPIPWVWDVRYNNRF